jgi:hypothetical protein
MNERAMNGRSKNQLESMQNQVTLAPETECVRLGMVKLPRSTPTLWHPQPEREIGLIS